MSNLFELFNPNAAHWRRQRDLDKVAVVPSRNGAQGPMRIDLDKGTIVLPARPASDVDPTATAEAETSSAKTSSGPVADQDPSAAEEAAGAQESTPGQ
ncbi:MULTISPECIES: hypothetical protein [Aestuariimicrobium]|uniref:hypothetical protein n=1 Tax=Aestuariimicrobium TaxID=396388 RepID=UPI00047E8C5C|nr:MULTISPECIES: hypothetical protein [Aestuariimicrobium]CAI9399579.1 hypothetical protein AESSP_00219 [Aestuariimicrobium sp. T2.26MG-19.2B]